MKWTNLEWNEIDTGNGMNRKEMEEWNQYNEVNWNDTVMKLIEDDWRGNGKKSVILNGIEKKRKKME